MFVIYTVFVFKLLATEVTMESSMERPSSAPSGKRPLFGVHRWIPDVLPSQVVQYAVEFSEVVAIVLCFSTPELGCHDLFQVGSRTTTQHGVEIGIRACENGRFILTAGINGRANGKPLYLEYPPLNSDAGLHKHSVIQYHDPNPSLPDPKLLYQSEIVTYLNADWLRPLAFSRRLEFKNDSDLGLVWEDKFSFPGTLHHCHQFRLSYPDDVHAWQEVHESILKQQKLAFSVPGHSDVGLRTALKAVQPSIAQHCLSMFVKVTVPVCFQVTDVSIQMKIKGSESLLSGLPDVAMTFPKSATERVILHFQEAFCRGQVTAWSYDREGTSLYVPCSDASFPPVIGGLIPLEQKSLDARASLWKRNED